MLNNTECDNWIEEQENTYWVCYYIDEYEQSIEIFNIDSTDSEGAYGSGYKITKIRELHHVIEHSKGLYYTPLMRCIYDKSLDAIQITKKQYDDFGKVIDNTPYKDIVKTLLYILKDDVKKSK